MYATIGRAEPAIWHAHNSLAICESDRIGDFDLGFAYEALARAHAVGGDTEESARWLQQARNAAAGVEDDDDRRVLLADLATIVAG
ncbi:MAG: hypothetical protein ACJ735_17710 [Actinomycetes bacterium]